MPLAPAPSDFLLYAFAGVLLMFAGVGVFRMLRAPIEGPVMWLLAPAVAESVWAIALGLGTTERVPVRLLAGPIWIGTCALALYGYRWKRGWDIRAGSLVGLSLGLPVLVMLPNFLFGLASYPGSRLPDGWSYVAYGQYLWEYARGSEGGLQPLYQYASHLSETRHVAPAQLGLLSVLTDAGNAQAGTGLFLALMLYGFGSACAAFVQSRQWPLGSSLLLVTVTTLSGWMMNAIFANNYDNLAALAAFPALATLTTLLRERALSLWVLMGLVFAGLVYTYPELAGVVGPLLGVMVTERIWKTPTLRSWRGVATSAAVFALLISPYATTAIRFFITQARAGLQAGSRPGEGYFPGLLVSANQLSAFWSLGGENQITSFRGFQVIAAIGLFLLLARGLTRLVRARDIGLLCVLTLPLLAAPFFVVKAAYSYGAYKMIVLGWWALVFAVVSGASEWRGSSLVKACASALALVTCLAVPVVATVRAVHQVVNPPASGTDRFRPVSDAAEFAAGSPIGVFVDDWEASEWAVYFLREAQIRLGDFDAYLAMPHVRARLARSPVYPWADVRFVLTDAIQQGPVLGTEGWTLVWQNAAYRLWDTGASNWAIVTEARVPNGLEQVGGKPFFWIGGGPTALRLIAREAGCVLVSATMVPGPSVKRTDGRTITIETSAGQHDTVALMPGQNRFAWRVQPDANDITLAANDEPDLPRRGSDQRPLVVGLTNLTTHVEQSFARVRDIDNPNGLEQLDGQPFFWLGAGPATVHVVSDAAGTGFLTADLVAGPSLSPTVTSRRLRIRVSTTGRSYDVIVASGPWTLPIDVVAGETLVQIEALDHPTLLQQKNGDRRPLVLGVRNLRVNSTTLSQSCR